ncbi:hypothetical protein TrLO_g3369 [Triparma laevis f. longispina]|uniref:Endonuclease/exonuclease/phosphatase domain-containing protein n=1 Tax=Triparma laevis f. longispina TaxID=1714387 RepID=A0A9W7AUQ9_9STRA|nr:hypothetical protein TrLO_g3369 [Triparma laevis f. longispina]
MRVFSYNLLSSSLSSPSYFTTLLPENLLPTNRYSKIIGRLEEEVGSRSLICLQEVSRNWVGDLQVFFSQNEYDLITGLYGPKFNGYMGVCLAYPRDKYRLKNVWNENLADTEKWPKREKVERGVVGKVAGWPFQTLLNIFNLQKKRSNNEDAFDASKRRSNILITAQLEDIKTKDIFNVGTYHMPCAFRTPQVMTLHSELAVRRSQNLSEGKPFLLVGDWNFTPDSKTYEMVTTGALDKPDDTYPKREGVDWEVNIGEGVGSAYMTAFGKEPEYTNWARIKEEPEFKETLDYIFYSKNQWTVKSADEVEDAGGVCPNEKEGSDHLSIAAEMVIKK